MLVSIRVAARKGSLGQGNVFTPVCHSVQRCPLDRDPTPGQRPGEKWSVRITHSTGMHSCLVLMGNTHRYITPQKVLVFPQQPLGVHISTFPVRNSFIFTHFLTNISRNNRVAHLLWELPALEILDPPVLCLMNQ